MAFFENAAKSRVYELNGQWDFIITCAIIIVIIISQYKTLECCPHYGLEEEKVRYET